MPIDTSLAHLMSKRTHPTPELRLRDATAANPDDRVHRGGIRNVIGSLSEGLATSTVSHEQHEVALRELAQAQAQLLHAAKLAAIGQLAAGVAHELNQPLQIIGLSLEDVRDAVLSSNTQSALEFIDLIEEQVTRGGAVVGRLLAFSRQDETRESALASINDVLTKALSVLRKQLTTAGIDLTLELDPNVDPVPCKVGELMQVVANLVINARDALAERDDPRIVARTFAAHDGVGFEIIDNGPGIATADLDRIFEPFFTTKGIGAGTGLGLSIVHGIIDRHGGTIEVRTPPGGGTCMRVKLPR
jgi:C4-dicarboxylate-specific signal transduction histidine kinase